MSVLWDLFVGFFRANILSYGGGPAAIPLIEAEVVERFHWATRDEFANALAMGNSLPGPIATKLAAYLGYRTAGWLGAAVAEVATVLPTALLMMFGAGLLFRFKDVPFVKGMIAGVRPVIWVLFVSLVLDYLSFVNSGWSPVLFAVVALVAIRVLNVHPAWVILFGMLGGGVLMGR